MIPFLSNRNDSGFTVVLQKIRIESNSYYQDFRTFSIRRTEKANHVVFALSRGEKTMGCEETNLWMCYMLICFMLIWCKLYNVSTYQRIKKEMYCFSAVFAEKETALARSREWILGLSPWAVFKSTERCLRHRIDRWGSISPLRYRKHPLDASFSIFWCFFFHVRKKCTSVSKFYGCKIYGHKRMGIWNSSTKGNWRGKGCMRFSGKLS